MSSIGWELHIEGREVVGEIALDIAPDTVAAVRDRRLDELLRDRLHEACDELQVVLAAAPSAFARPLPGKDADGKTRFAVRGRIEGERLVPARKAPSP